MILGMIWIKYFSSCAKHKLGYYCSKNMHLIIVVLCTKRLKIYMN